MGTPMSNQFILFCEAAALGLLVGANYDIFRALRACCRIKRTSLVFITDIFFWLSATIYCLWFIFYYRWGEIYTFTYFGLAVGAVAYFPLLSPHFFKFWYKFFSAVIKFLALIRRMFRRLLTIVACPAIWISTGAGAGVKKVKNIHAARRIFHYIYRKK